VFLSGGLGLGYCTADYAMTQGLRSVAVSNGPWTTWPYVARDSADPYTRAHFAGTGKLAVTSFEAITFRAEKDSDGRPLDLACSYEVAGQALAARWWSVTVYDDDGNLIANPADRYSFNSTEMTRLPDGGFTVRISSVAQPGNWIPISGGGTFFLLLRLYNAEPRLSNNLEGAPLPSVMRRVCA
jgi:hypothetical protein